MLDVERGSLEGAVVANGEDLRVGEGGFDDAFPDLRVAVLSEQVVVGQVEEGWIV